MNKIIPKYEYKIDVIDIPSRIDAETYLNEKGKEGWELCTMIFQPSISKNFMTFKRIKGE